MSETFNTFSPSFGNRPNALVGRQDVIGEFLSGLKGVPGNMKRATFFSGQRGMGKTALLLELASKAEKMDFVVANVLANAGMMDEIIQLLQLNGAGYVDKSPGRFKAINVGVPGFSFGLTFSDEIKELAATYQHLVGEGKNIAIAMAGLSSAVSGVLNGKMLTFLNRANKVRLASIPLNDISIYYSSVFKRLGKKIDAESLEKAVTATRGYPYLLQLVGYYILEYAGDSRTITRDAVQLAENSAKRELIETVYLPSLRPLSKTDMKFLRAMAESGESGTVAEVMKRMDASNATVQQYRARLIASGIVTSSAHGMTASATAILDMSSAYKFTPWTVLPTSSRGGAQ
ncbi:MAG: ATP-binding protein [Clostridiales Family XIII bacterium]|jgi:hypothetical protein|nr:ATP-binding protein [Clostridiales Family XIII bacterium]